MAETKAASLFLEAQSLYLAVAGVRHFCTTALCPCTPLTVTLVSASEISACTAHRAHAVA